MTVDMGFASRLHGENKVELPRMINHVFPCQEVLGS